MAAASKLLAFLAAAPLPILAARRLAPSYLRCLRRRSLYLPPNHYIPSSRTHSSASCSPSTPAAPSLLVSGPPEWVRLVDQAMAGAAGDDGSLGLLEGQVVEEEFVRVARACLAFAKERPELIRSLSKKDLETLLNLEVPFLFKDKEESMRRLQSFLSEQEVYGTEKVETTDVMRLLLSYAYNYHNGAPLSEGPYDISARSLLAAFANSGTEQSSGLDPLQNSSSPWEDMQFRGLPGQNIEMKRGDWICPKCSFMNFARNSTCLECSEARPRRALNGGEWECPQCTFFNYSKNMSCLRCDCKRPVETASNQPFLGYGIDSSSSSNEQMPKHSGADRSDSQRILGENDEKAERWLSKVSQLGDSADINRLAADEDFPDIMPLHKGDNRFVVSTRKAPAERLANAQFSKTSSSFTSPKRSSGIQQNLINQRPQPDSFATVPFVPFPPDMFAKTQNNKTDDHNYSASSSLLSSDNNFNGKSSSDEAERWSKKVSEIDNVTNLSGSISDADFPELMPMRRGDNQFVVNKKKDRSLTSPQYKRRIALEQENNSNFVPFVPFPPNYFASSDKPSDNNSARNVSANSEHPGAASQHHQTKLNNEHGSRQQQYNNFSNFESSSTDYTTSGWKSENSHSSTEPYSSRTHSSTGQSSYSRSWNSSTENASSGYSNAEDNWNRGYSYNSNYTTQSDNRSSYRGPDENFPAQTQEYDGWNNGPSSRSTHSTPSGVHGRPPTGSSNHSATPRFTGSSESPRRSLEGSAVKEPDPLDMSEEAKAERWFRRAAQIKNISELADIPDEDFPEIMPMRKGVNRFVVSKRKTPLERRLTSPQYRRNLPIVSSEPRENDAS